MDVVLGADLDDGGFPGPLGHPASSPREAGVLDAAWVGVSGLVALLEVRLGLLRLDPPKGGERAADLARRLRDRPLTPAGAPWPWAASLALDPVATARSVLRLRDAVVMATPADRSHSVDVTRLPPRLVAALEACVDARPGLPDRLLEIVVAVEAGEHPRVDRVRVVDDGARFPGLVHRLLRGLVGLGVEVRWDTNLSVTTAATSAPDSDLVRAQRLTTKRPNTSVDAVFSGDGSLVLWRPDTPEVCADDVAAFLVTHPDAVIIGGDVVLDEALHRRGLPTLGARGAVAEDALLSILPLVVALDDEHPDPERLYELVNLPVSPIPRAVAVRVERALRDAPSATAPSVLRAVLEGLEAMFTRHAADVGEVEALARRGRLAERLAALVPRWRETLSPLLPTPATGDDDDGPAATSPTTEGEAGDDVFVVRTHQRVDRLVERLKPLLTMLAGRGAREYGDAERSPYRAAMRQIGLCLRMLQALELQTVTRPQLMRILDAATRSVASMPPWGAEAGFARVGRPGCVCGPSSTIVWWNFTRERGRLPRPVLSAHERHALVAAGGELGRVVRADAANDQDNEGGVVGSTMGALADAFADAQSRPLRFATERLILCAPRRGVDGREQHPHPLWDEILAAIPTNQRRSAQRALQRPDVDGQGGGDDAGARLGLVPWRPVTAAPLLPLRSQLPNHPEILHRFTPSERFGPEAVTSPSREERLLGCEARFVVERGLGPSRPRHIKRGPALEGDVVHMVLARVLGAYQDREPGLPFHADDVARAVVAATLPDLAGAWLRPGQEQVALRTRERAARAAVAIIELIERNELSVVAVEAPFSVKRPIRLPDGTVDGERELTGSPDVVLQGVDSDGQTFRFVLDHKTGNDDLRRELLRQGAPLQLLDYALMVAAPGMQTAFGYFQLRSRRLLTSDTRLMGVEQILPERTVRQGFEALERARARAFAHLRRGGAFAPGTTDGLQQRGLRIVDTAQGPIAELPPPCETCGADLICGRFHRQLEKAVARSSPSSSSTGPEPGRGGRDA